MKILIHLSVFCVGFLFTLMLVLVVNSVTNENVTNQPESEETEIKETEIKETEIKETETKEVEENDKGLTDYEVEQAFFNAISYVESRNNVDAIGDNGKSFGIYQIQKPYWQDACEYLGESIPFHKVRDKRTCQRVMRAYWKRYEAFTWQERARVHNGGPNGFRIKATENYWSKVLSRFKYELYVMRTR